MRYLVSARVRPEERQELMKTIEDETFSSGFPYGNLGDVLCAGTVCVEMNLIAALASVRCSMVEARAEPRTR
jgi:hypothetical protein